MFTIFSKTTNNSEAPPPPAAEVDDFVQVDVSSTAAKPPIRTSMKKASLEAFADIPSNAFNKAHDRVGLLSIRAPRAKSEEEDDNRLPLEIVAVIDRSGSMQGEKMKLMKKTLKLLVAQSGLTPKDKVGLVTFDDQAEGVMSLRSMGASGRDKAISTIKKICAGGCTNLSGGLLLGCDMLKRAEEADSDLGNEKRNCTRVVLVFTDGIANRGIQKTEQIKAAAEAATASIGGSATTAVYTFGFGKDHNEDMLRAIAHNNGSYYFIEDADSIPKAFSDCIGGLVSVVAQNATITITTNPDKAYVAKVHGVESKKVKTLVNRVVTTNRNPTARKLDCQEAEAKEEGKETEEEGKKKENEENENENEKKKETTKRKTIINLGDLYDEDERDIVFDFKLPALAEPYDKPQATLLASLRYFDVMTNAFVEVSATVPVTRPAETPTGQEMPRKLEEHLLRVRAADAMEQAAKLADRGDVAEGRKILQFAKAIIEKSCVAKSEICELLCFDLDELVADFANKELYHRKGSKKSKMYAASQRAQKSNHMQMGAKLFCKGKKKRFMANWVEAGVDEEEEE